MKDVATQDSELSLWRVADDQSDLDEVITAFASTRQKPDNVDYVLINLQKIEAEQFEIDDRPSEQTALQAAAGKHVNLFHLTGSRLHKLCIVLYRDRDVVGRKTGKSVFDLLSAAMQDKRLAVEKLDPKLVAALTAPKRTLS